MAKEDLVLVIDKPQFTVKLHESLLEVDLKEGVKKELEDVFEAKAILRETLGFLFQTVIPLDVPLKDIESVSMDEKGHVKVVLPHRKDIVIPLDKKESKKLVDKLNALIPIEKQKEIKRIMNERKAEAEREREQEEVTAYTKKELTL